MGRTKEVYKYWKQVGKCGICGRPARKKEDGTYYSVCDRCYTRNATVNQRKAKAATDFVTKPTLCWKCQHAVPCREKGLGCNWSRRLEPVEGWEAVKREIKVAGSQSVSSYMVINCPMFKEDKKRCNQ